MLRTAFLSLIFLASVSSSSMLRKSVVRRQNEPQYCQAIEGFECKCSYYRVTCTTERDLQTPIQVLPNEKQKYQSVELVIAAPSNLQVSDHTFDQIKELYKPDGDNLEFRVKFEKFTGLHLSSPGLFNRVFPDNLQPNVRKHLAVDIYTPDVPHTNNVNLFQGLNVDSLELFGLYPFHGSFQQLFNGANIKFLRLSGGDISSDLSQPFSGNVGRVELAKQASALSVQNFPIYPTHELVINAFYVSDFNNENPPNYSNLKELRVFSTENIPAGAFRQFPNLQTLSVTTEKDIDPNAFSGLTNLEKLTIKDTKPSLSLLNSVPSVKEFETNIEKLDENTQCQFLDKLANGQIAVQAIPNGRECTCVSAYLDAAAGRAPCDAQHCEHSSCAAIKNNYDASTRTFKAPPAIRRSDGSDALRQHDARVYSGPFQVTQQDKEKLQHGAQQQVSPTQTGDDSQRPNEGEGEQAEDIDPSPAPFHLHLSVDTFLDPQSGPSDSLDNPNDRPDPSYMNENGQSNNEPKDEESPTAEKNPYEESYSDNTNDSNQPKDEQSVQYPSDGESNPPESPVADDNQNRNDETNNDYTSETGNNPPEKEESSDVYENNEPKEDDGNRFDESGVDQISTTVLTEDYQESDRETTTTPEPSHDGNRDDQEGDSVADNEGGDNQQGEQNENQDQGENTNPDFQEGAGNNGTETGEQSPAKKGMSWLPIIIIAASIVGLLLIGLVILLLRKKRANRGYGPTSTNETPGAAAPRA